MNPQTIIGYTVALMTGLFGAVLLGGYLDNNIPDRLRLTLGIVLLLLSIYRFAVTTIAVKNRVI